MHPRDTDAALRRVEAARYALLRRLSLAMRHRMLAHLQPIGMMGEVLERRLHEDAPDLARLGADIDRMQSLTRDAVATNLDMVTWLAPETQGPVALDAGIGECVALLRGHFAYRGFSLRHASSDGDHVVTRTALRALLPAVLFALTDEARDPAQVTVASEPDTGTLQVRLQDDPAAGPAAAEPPYRPLAWDDVEALAGCEGVALTHGAGGATLRFGAV